MPTNALPGRSGNLTPEQELKLQEFWTALLRLTGVSLPNEPLPNGRSALREAAQQRDRADSSDSAKKKHSRLQSMFSRKKEGVSDDDSSRAGSSEDKYGQEKDFQTVLASVSPVELRKALWSMAKSDDPDDLMLRFLRARKWNVHNALVMLISTIHWRLEFRVDDDIMRNGEHGAILDQASSDPIRQKRGKDFIFQLEKGKSFVHGTDREGRPMCFVRTRLHRAADQDPSALDRTTVYVIETARLTLLPPVDTATVVFDMTDFSMANMDYNPVKFMIKIFEANYPESLGCVLVHRAPWAFNAIWHIIKGWLDPVVASKVHFTSNIGELSRFVEPSHIPKELGGEDPWTYEYVPAEAGEHALMEDSATREKLDAEREELARGYEIATMAWVKQPGSPEIRAERAALREKLRKGYWDLDPYVRARSMYDRTGMINKGGRIQFYPAAVEEGKGGVEDMSAEAPQKVVTNGDGGQIGAGASAGGLTSKPVMMNGYTTATSKATGNGANDNDVD